MITLVEPQQHIAKLWSKPAVREGETYRLMRYVLRVDHEGKVLLHNVVTGQLVVLEEQEALLLNQLPAPYSAGMCQLIEGHYLVPDHFDEHRQAAGMRKALWLMNETQQQKSVIHYTILPTTSCNARCYYCFEKGLKSQTMTESTADNVAAFIARSCNHQKEIHITWFGGEPTVASNRISQICSRLHDMGIRFHSQMITNGYLFDEELIEEAVSHWNLRMIQITIDGTEKSYNSIKSYVNVTDNPYERVMRNAGLMLERNILVNLRMNFDLQNYRDFKLLADEIVKRFGHHSMLRFRAHPVNGEYPDKDGIVEHGDNKWFESQVLQLNSYAAGIGLYQGKKHLPSLKFQGCMAMSDSCVTITPDGHLVSCPEQVDSGQYKGDVIQGLIRNDVYRSWKKTADYDRCALCALYPDCMRAANCSAKDRCQYLLFYQQEYADQIRQVYTTRTLRKEDKDDFPGTEDGVCPD